MEKEDFEILKKHLKDVKITYSNEIHKETGLSKTTNNVFDMFIKKPVLLLKDMNIQLPSYFMNFASDMITTIMINSCKNMDECFILLDKIKEKLTTIDNVISKNNK